MSVLCVGNLVLDLLAWPVDKLRWDATVWVDKMARSVGGNGANTSYTLARMGMPVALAGAVGNDADGEELLRLLAEAGVDITQVAKLDLPTPATIALVKKTGSRAFVHRPGASRESLRDAVTLSGQRHMHVANPFGVIALRTMAVENLKAAKAAGMTTSLDAGWDSKGEWGTVILPCLPWVDVFFVNQEEARLISGETAWRKALGKLGAARTVVMKRGKKGAVIQGKGFEASVPAFEVDAIDSTGAGDVFAGAFLAAWLKGMTMSEAARFANAAAAMSVMELGSVAGVKDFRRTLLWMRERTPSS